MPKIRGLDRARLEAAAAAGFPKTILDRNDMAKAEIVRRDRQYLEEQGWSRRKFETDRDSDREKLERELSDAAEAREAARQGFEEKLAQRQIDHAAALAREQLDTAQAAARAAKMPAWAAGVAALGAIGQIIVAALK
jgi:hypothetical protein